MNLFGYEYKIIPSVAKAIGLFLLFSILGFLPFIGTWLATLAPMIGVGSIAIDIGNGIMGGIKQKIIVEKG